MKKLSLILLAGLTLQNCSNNPELNKTYWGTGIGALTGVAAGLATGDDSKERLRNALVGAGVGAAAGGGIGYYMDTQAQEFKDELANTHAGYQEQIRVEREANDILINMPSAITFNVNSARLKPAFYSPLDKIVGVVNKYDQTKLVITGHTDSTGSMEYNQRLSQERAASVGQYLASRGVNGLRIQTQGAGESLPVADNNTEYGRAQNRRVEIRITPAN